MVISVIYDEYNTATINSSEKTAVSDLTGAVDHWSKSVAKDLVVVATLRK